MAPRDRPGSATRRGWPVALIRRQDFTRVVVSVKGGAAAQYWRGGAARLERQMRNTSDRKNGRKAKIFRRFCTANGVFQNNVARLERQTRSASVNGGGL